LPQCTNRILLFEEDKENFEGILCMVLKYLPRSSPLYEASTGKKIVDKLIYGEQVDTIGESINGRSPVKFRRRSGWINESDLSAKSILELYFIDVGQGDSTFIVTPKRKKILVDGGLNERASHFLAWKYYLNEPDSEPITIDLLVLTHADEDHINGLIPVISHPKIRVERIVHSGLATFKKGAFKERLGDLSMDPNTNKKYVITCHDQISELDDENKLSDGYLKWKKAILADGITDYHAINSDTGEINIDDPNITLEVLGPRTEIIEGKKAYRWFDAHGYTINAHSVVLRLGFKSIHILLAGDLNRDGEDYLLQDRNLAKKMDANVLKAPHHGSHDFSRHWLDLVNPQISIISSGDDVDHGHPRAIFIGAIGNASRQPAYVFSTEIAANFIQMQKKYEKGIGVAEEERLRAASTATHIGASSTQSTERELFKRRLHGMINIRTDGNILFAARRVASSYMWEYYNIDKPAIRSKPQD
jgi:competence protein ComEC